MAQEVEKIRFLLWLRGQTHHGSRQAKLQKADSTGWNDIRRHQRKSYSKSIRFAAKELIFEGFLKNISSAGVFIEAAENFSAGQILTFEIPLKGNQKAKVKGKVVWSSPNGFGVKFLSIDKQEPTQD